MLIQWNQLSACHRSVEILIQNAVFIKNVYTKVILNRLNTTQWLLYNQHITKQVF